MRKVGDILKKRRLEKNLTLEEVEKRTKIRKRFLQAIEESNYSLISSSTYLRGFIKNYSDFLNLPTQQILAIFRREFTKNEKIDILPKGLSEPLHTSFTRITPTKVGMIVVATLLLLFFGYLIKGYISVVGVPNLEVSLPKAGQKVVTEKVLVEGKTDPYAQVKINNQPVLVNKDGYFSQEVNVSENTTSITVVSENKEGKKAVVERVIEVVLPEKPH